MNLKNILQESRLGVYGIAIDAGRILLVRKKSGPYLGLWDLPGGKIEFGESPEEALNREVREEAGLSYSQSRLQANLSHVADWNGGRFHHIGLIYWIEGFRQGEKGEDEADWFLLSSLKKESLTPFASIICENIRAV